MRLYKTITYKLGSLITTILIVYLFVGKLSVATWVGVLDLISTTLWYYWHDKFWENIERRKLAKEAKKNIAARYEEWVELKKENKCG